jgi:hypothetical protein
VFEDESGFSLVSPLKCTWAPRGHTPVVRTSLSHHDHVNVIGALLVTPAGRRIRLCVHTHRTNLSGDEIIAFVQAVLHTTPGPIVWVWDNHPIHRRAGVREFLNRHERLHVYHFPTCAPELNPEASGRKPVNTRPTLRRGIEMNSLIAFMLDCPEHATRSNACGRASSCLICPGNADALSAHLRLSH